MNKFRILTGHIFLQKIKSKMFVISTIILLLISTIVVIWPKIQDEFLDNDERTEIYIINQSQQNIPNTLHSSTAIDYIQTKKPIKILQKQVKKGNKDGILLLKDGINGQLLIELQTYEELSTVEKQSIEQDVAGFNQLLTIKRANLTHKQVEDIFNSKIEIKETSLSPNVSSKSDEDKQIGAYLSYGVGFLIYIFILSYLSMITNDVAIEKSSRIMEVLISSVS
ncbi:ABC transporter permease, partial [Priestia filamentosa]|uniref:ABC transporter permease n=1 Tax=Priestia filamentosa TaxID=1402861 RepID=UPI003982F657